MFTIPVKKDGSTSISATSSTTFTYTDIIPLTAKYYDKKNLSLKVDILCYANTGLSTDSGQLFVFPAIAESYGGTYVAFTSASGSSLIITSGTSVSGLMSNGSYYIPLSIYVGAGVTETLKTVPFIKFGYRAFQNTRPWQATLCVG